MEYTHLFQPTFLNQLCEEAGLRPSKQYGQNYLISEKPIVALLDAAEIAKDDVVVEVGPGFGVLTLALAQRAKQVVAFEIEQLLREYWEAQQHTFPNIELIWGNVLHMFGDICEERFADTPYKVAANLPYQITSAVLRLFLEATYPPVSITAMVQREVADRICAQPGDMSLLALSVQYYGTPKRVLKVPSGSFHPAPKVDSAVIHIADIAPKSDAARFFTVAKAGFAAKRKQLAKNLAVGLGMEQADIRQHLEALGMNPKVRAQELSVDQWQQLTDILYA